MPRPVKHDPRDCFRTFRFTEAEITRLEARARASGCNLSVYVRAMLLDSDLPARSQENALPGKPAGRSREPAARVVAEQMRRVGVNLNQIARRMNELHIPPPRELTSVLSEIRTYVRQAREP